MDFPYRYKNPWVKQYIARIQSELIDHAISTDVFDELCAQTSVRNPGEFIALLGPNRIGKTLLLQQFENMLNPTTLDEKRAFLPVLRVEADNSGDAGSFDTKAFYEQVLKSLRHSIYSEFSNDPYEVRNVQTVLDRARIRGLRTAIVAAMRALKTRFFIIDESQHFDYINRRGSVKAASFLDSLKSLMTRVDCIVIVAGDYALLDVVGQSKHMVNRLTCIEYPRYDINRRCDLEEFETILAFYSQGIEFEEGVTSLRDWNQQIWHGSLGIIGNVSEWIRDAVVAMDVSGDSKLNYEHLKSTCPPDWDLAMNRQSIADGEKKLRGKENPLQSFRVKGSIRELEPKVKKDRPFQTKPARRKQGGRLNRAGSPKKELS